MFYVDVAFAFAISLTIATASILLWSVIRIVLRTQVKNSVAEETGRRNLRWILAFLCESGRYNVGVPGIGSMNVLLWRE